MAFPNTFKTDTKALSEGYVKYMVSRVVSDPQDKLVEIEIPTVIPDQFVIELNFYTTGDNYLISTILLDNTSDIVVEQRILQYANAEIRKLLFIDFNTVKDNFPVGEYIMVVNVYAPEIAGGTDTPLQATTISPSRTEIELELTAEFDTEEYQAKLAEFANPRLDSDAVLTALAQIFGKSTSAQLQSDNSSYTYELIRGLLPSDLSADVSLDLETMTQIVVDGAYSMCLSTLESDIADGKTTFTNIYLKNLVTTNIIDQYVSYISSLSENNIEPKVILTTDGLIV